MPANGWCGRAACRPDSPRSGSPTRWPSIRAAGRLVALDCSGHPLEHVLAQHSDRLPHLVKPNAEELAEVAGRTLHYARRRRRRRRSCCSRAGCAPCWSASAATVRSSSTPICRDRCTAPQPVRRVVNTVGAGDAFLAGWLAAAHAGAAGADALASALRFGAAAVEHRGHAARRTRPATSGLHSSDQAVEQLIIHGDKDFHVLTAG